MSCVFLLSSFKIQNLIENQDIFSLACLGLFMNFLSATQVKCFKNLGYCSGWMGINVDVRKKCIMGICMLKYRLSDRSRILKHCFYYSKQC